MIFKYFRAFTISCITASSLLISDVKSDAQITPDVTLPINSNVTLEGNTFNITGGSTAGSNLFHSFKDFSINSGSSAFFNNAVNIQNIITRVTGKSISNIDGLIKANGASNLFLINPNGIVLGQNARLEIGGSFLATSANSMTFESGFEFSASDTESKSLLTITAPVGLQFGTNPGSIQIQGNGEGVKSEESAIIDTQNALLVQPNKTLALVGGDINLEGATLKTAGGRIELGSVAAHSLVSLTPINKGFALSYGGVQNFGNIQLSQQAIVDASGEGAGDAQVQGRRITVTSGSEIQVNTIREKQGGDLIVNATESLEVSGFSALDAIVYPEATGNAANLRINTRELLIRDGANVRTATFGGGKGGNLTVTADTIQVIGRPGDGRFDSYLTTQTEGTGDAGNLAINTRELLIQNGSQVAAGTLSSGNAGNLAVTASRIQVIGGSSLGRRSNLATASEGTGNAGDLTINTSELLVKDEAFVSASTLGVGNAGNLTINTRELLVRDGANIAAGTVGRGKAGNLTINADNIQVIGISSTDSRFFSLLTAQTQGAGNAGNLTINTRELLVQDGARINVQSSGTGIAGNLTINANSINLDKNAALNVNTRNNRTDVTQATININSRDLILRRASSITTNATGREVIGGDININTQVLGAFENSKITANSANARGGNINIRTQSIFRSPDSAVTASGATSALSGNVLITTLIDTSSALVEIPVNLIDPSRQILAGCSDRRLQNQNSFTITGRSRLPNSPDELQDIYTPNDWINLENLVSGKTGQTIQAQIDTTANPIVEATSWEVDNSGQVYLVASTQDVQSQQLVQKTECNI